MSLKPKLKPQSKDAPILDEFFEQIVQRATVEGDLTRRYPLDPSVPHGILPIEFNFGALSTCVRLLHQEDGYYIIVRTGSFLYNLDNAQKTAISIADANCIEKVVELVDQARHGIWIPTEQE